jgi:hypothetical protein
MSIADFISSKLNQTCVYWGTPQEDGYGTKTYGEPVELACRWEDRVQLVKNEIANTEFLSRAVVYLSQDVEIDGVLYLGVLDDLDSDAIDDPFKQDGTYIIKIFDKIPSLNTPTVFIRTATLSEYLF